MTNTVHCQPQKTDANSTDEPLITVLHVDDDEDFQICFKRYLEKQGAFKVENALNFKAAIIKIGQKPFDIIVCDQQIPIKTGTEFLKHLRCIGNVTPFFLLTGDTRPETLNEALEIGACRVFNKDSPSEKLYFELAHSIKQRVKQKNNQNTKHDSDIREIIFQQMGLLEAFSGGLDVKILIVSQDYRILWSNMTKEHGTDVFGEKCYEVIHQKDYLCQKCGVKQIFDGLKDKVVIQKKCKVFGKIDAWIESTVTPIKDKNGKTVAALELVIPIDERKKAEIKLIESENKFRAITSFARDGIILINGDGKVKLWNPAAEKIFGYTKNEAIGKDLHTLIAPKMFSELYGDSLASFKITGEVNAVRKSFEFDGIRKDGKVVPIEVSLSALKLKGKWNALAIVRDYTERKEAWTSLEQTINELVKINEKLGVVGRLTRHDARNKLSVILNTIYIAKQTQNNQQKTEHYLQDMESVVDQMTKIFDFASHYEKLGIEELTYNSVEKRFKEAAALVTGTNTIQIVSECSGLHVLADSLLRQLFYNLIHNSVVHGKNVNNIKMHYEEQTEQLLLVYEDNGAGVLANEKEKIFKEGYGKGTGFGLYLIRKICEAYGWTIHETGIPNKGAIFVISVPKVNKEGKMLYHFEN